MPNIRQQEKRVRQASRQRLENLRWRSTAKTLMRRLDELAKSAAEGDRNLLVYLIAVKRSHIVELERELALIRYDSDWWKREDAEWRIVHGSASP